MKNLVILAIVLIFFGCHFGVERPDKPDNLISEAKMVDIMCDIYLLNSAKGINRRTLEQNGVLPENYVFEKYGIDSAQFANSNNYYAYDTKTYGSILERIREKLNTKKNEYEALDKVEEEASRRKADSLREVRAKVKDSLINISKLKSLKSKKVN